MSTAKPLRWAIVSTGRMSSDFANALKIAGAEVTAVSSRTQESADAFGDKFAVGVKNRFVTLEAMLAHANELFDVVYVATPHSQHVHDVLLALRAGVHVLCEKPFCVSSAQLQRCIDAHSKANRFLMEGMWTRFFPVTREVNELINVRKAIGQVRHVSGTFGWYDDLSAARMTDLLAGGGALLDVGCYLVAFASLGLGGFHNTTPTHVHARSVLGSTGADMFTNVRVEMPNGASADLTASFLSPMPNSITFFGTLGTVKIHSMFHAPIEATIELCDGDQFGKVDTTTLVRPIEGAEAGDTKLFNFHGSRGLVFEIAAVTDAIRAGKLDCAEMPLAESLAILKVMDQARAQIGVHYPDQH